MYPTKEEAERLLSWANEQNPGQWVSHCRVTGRAAEAIAKECGMDSNRAYVCGLLHDIGRYKGVFDLRHIYEGYVLMMEQGYPQVADICITHSFPTGNFEEYLGKADCSQDEIRVIQEYLENRVYDDFDRLIQLCDAMCDVNGVCLIEKRIVNVVIRYGFNEFTVVKWKETFRIKDYFESMFTGKTGKSIYDLFYDEVREVSF